MKSLCREDLEEIIIETTNQGRGSLDHVKDALTAAKNEIRQPSNGPDGSPEWCKCAHCQEMETIIENKCCGFKKCVTTYRLFGKCCFDKDCLMLSIKAWVDMRADEHNLESNNYGKAEYQQFTLWKYGRLGKGNRRVLPSCVVWAVRREYHSRDGVYMGYKADKYYLYVYI